MAEAQTATCAWVMRKSGYGFRRIDYRVLQQLLSSCVARNAVDGISLVVVIVAVGMLVLAAQRYFANKRLANKRRNTDQS